VRAGEAALGVAAPEVFSVRCEGRRVELLLVRSPLAAHHDPAPAASKPDQPVTDQGWHEFDLALVFGAHAGQGASAAARLADDSYRALPLENPPLAEPSKPLDLIDIRNSLKSLMWRSMGVRREAESMREALENINHWSRYVLASQFADPVGWELQNMLVSARLMIASAIGREETRGCHVRIDFPERDDVDWSRHTTLRWDQ